MRKKIFACVFLFSACLVFQAAEFSMDQARRVDDFLTRISQKPNKTIFLKKVTFSESELNSYLNLIYTKKNAPEVTYIYLNLDDKNQIAAEAKVKLTGAKDDAVPEFLRDITIKCKGKIECTNYRMRFLFDELFVNNTRFSPEILDEAYSTAQGSVNIKKSLFDWFTLLPGLKNVTTSSKTITFLY